MRTRYRQAFSLIELIVVIMIIGILAAVAIPIMRGRVDKAKWSEANTAAGSIRRVVRAYVAEHGSGYDYSVLEGALDDVGICGELELSSTDLSGTYFNQSDYTISNVVTSPAGCTVTVTSSSDDGPSGTGTLSADGSWSLSE